MKYAEFLEEWNSECPYIVAHTSGSTGKPKDIMLPKSVMSRSAQRTIDFFGINPYWRLHSCISPDFIGGKMVAVRALMADCMFTYEQPSNEPVMSPDQGIIDIVSVVPSQMVYVLDHPEQFRHVQRYLVGGSPLPLGMRELIMQRGMKVWESYGMTETASHIAVRSVGRENSFTPMPGITIDRDARGCLIICGATDSPIVTNDLVEIDAEGRFRILGRIDNVIITGGRKVISEALEEKIRRLTGIDAPMIVSGVPDPKWGERLVLYIEGLSATAAESRELMSKLKSGLEPWECPKEIHYVETLARTPNGKIIR